MIFLKIGGVINLLVATLHLGFWRLFDWSDQLTLLTVVNSNIMQMLNLFTIVFFIYTAFVLLFKTRELLSSPMGRHIVGLLGTLYAARLGMEFYFPEGSLGFAGFLLFTTLMFVVPILPSRKYRHAHS